ncbi:alpha/beta fold hydrolase [Hyphococcus sp.]|uniref:alpha/beta fold hydrolase n=1 Tax=Hyphococcus sp. TaxID=2038636 RepID=UPI003D102441
MRIRSFTLIFAVLIWPLSAAWAQDIYPAPVEGDFVIDDFEFGAGDMMDLAIHYRTIGTLRRDADGRAANAVLIMHGTTGSGASLLRPSFADYLFKKGGLLDAEDYFIILPDGIGHGDSSKPSDGMRMDFPKYDYDDMVRAQHALLTDGLGVDHLRLVMGTSMGGMHTWVWAYMYPDFMDAAMPLASLPVEIAGRNRMQRKMVIDAIMDDPEWNGGNYKNKPMRGMKAAMYPLIFMVSSPLQYQKQAPTREEAEAFLDQLVERYTSALDPNDTIYAFDASRNYNPQPHLGDIKTKLVAVNSADDQVNPPELNILETEIEKVPNGEAVFLPITDETRGHGTHTIAEIWAPYLEQLLEATD